MEKKRKEKEREETREREKDPTLCKCISILKKKKSWIQTNYNNFTLLPNYKLYKFVHFKINYFKNHNSFLWLDDSQNCLISFNAHSLNLQINSF